VWVHAWQIATRSVKLTAKISMMTLTIIHVRKLNCSMLIYCSAKSFTQISLNNGEPGQSHQTGMHTNTWLNNVLQHREFKWYFTEEN
jgi:hypothetical protein